jgi:hypothetical protein
MDSSDISQDPLATNGATSFAPDFDMSAVNEAVAAGGEAETIQNTFNAADIDLSNTPTSDADLQQQLNDNPGMSLANSGATVDAPADPAMATAEMPLEASTDVAAAPIEAPTDMAAAPAEAPVDMTAAEAPVEPMQSEAPVAAAENPADPTATQAPEAAPAMDATPAAQPAPSANPEIKKSKTPTYILIGLSILAVVSVIIAVIVSLGNK